MKSLPEIAGSWDIASFDGHTPVRLGEGVRQAYVHVRTGGLSYAIECNRSGNAAHIDQTGTLHDDEGDRVMTLMGCPAERAARDRKFFQFFASKPKVHWDGPARLKLTSRTTELLLEKPALRRRSFLIQPDRLVGRWVPHFAVGLNTKTGSTGESFTQPVMVIITPTSLTYTGCGGVRFAFRYTADGQMADVVQQGRANCGSDFASATLVEIMRNNPMVERDASGLALTAGADAISLKPETGMRRPERRSVEPAASPLIQ